MNRPAWIFVAIVFGGLFWFAIDRLPSQHAPFDLLDGRLGYGLAAWVCAILSSNAYDIGRKKP